MLHVEELKAVDQSLKLNYPCQCQCLQQLNTRIITLGHHLERLSTGIVFMEYKKSSYILITKGNNTLIRHKFRLPTTYKLNKKIPTKQFASQYLLVYRSSQ